MRTTFRSLAVLGLAAGLLLAACGDDSGEKVSAGAGGDTATLEGTQWVLELSTLDVSSGTSPTSGVASTGTAKATLLLENGQATGTDGCNQFNGSYTLKGSDLTFGTLATTGMMCTPELTAAGTKVTKALADTTGYTISGSSLTLTGAGGNLLTYQAGSATALVGNWQIVGYLDAAKQAFSSTLADPPATVTFADDGTVSGTAGCNNFSGTYSADATNITFSPLAATNRACVPDEVMMQESLVLAGLQSAVTWQTTANGVDLFNAEGIRGVSLAPPA